MHPDRVNRRPPLWQAALLYVALTAVMAYPLTIHPAGAVVSVAPDTDFSLWALSWDAHAIAHQPLSMFEANIYYPEHRTLAYSENLIGSAPIAAPVLWLTGNAVLAMNLVVLTACVLCGLGTYLLACRLGIGPYGALLCGVVFAFTPPRFLRLDQVHLATIQWIPFGLASLQAYLDDGRPRDAAMTAGFVSLQALSSGHGAVFLLTGIVIVVITRFVLHGRRALRGTPAGLGAAAALLVPAALALWPYRIVQQEMGLKRSLEAWSVPWTSFLASSSHADAFLASVVPSWQINDVMGPHLFPGVVPLVLAAAALLAGRAGQAGLAGRGGRTGPGRAGRAGLAGLAALLEIVASGVIALGVYVAATGATRITVGGVTLMSIRQTWRVWGLVLLAIGLRLAIRPRSLQLVRWLRRTGDWFSRWRSAHRDDPRVAYGAITMISLWLSAGPPIGLWPLVYRLPGLNFIRAPSRFTLLTALGLSVLAGIGFERVSSRLTPGRRRAAALAAGVVILSEFFAGPFGIEPYRVEPPPVERWLAEQPTPFVVAEVPAGNPRNYGQWEQREATFMLHSTAHWQKTVHGYSGFRSEAQQRLLTELAEFPDEHGLQHLHELGVTYLVVHTDLYPPGGWPPVEERIAGLSGWLMLAHVDGDGRVYALRRPR